MWNHDAIIKKVFYERRSCRVYKQEFICDKIINNIIEVGLKSPVAGGISCVQVKHITDKVDRNICYKASFYQDAVLNAPNILAVIVDKAQIANKYKEPFLSRFVEQNGAVVMMNMINYCSMCDIATCYVGGIRTEILKSRLCNENEEIVALLLLGYGGCNEKNI